jgi:hypothetical protein
MKIVKLIRRAIAWLAGKGLFPWMGSWSYRDLYDFPEHPTKPCRLCTGSSSVPHKRDPITGETVYKTSWQLCFEMGVCTATIDWDEVYRSS